MAPHSTLERRRRLIHRALPLGGLAIVALGFGLAMGSGVDSSSQRTARAFGLAWERHDYRSMHDMLSGQTKRAYSLSAFTAAYEDAATTATAQSVTVGEPRGDGDDVALPVRVDTRVFGVIRGELRLPTSEEAVDWRPRLVFPGLVDGQRLRRKTVLPERAKIVSRDGKTLVEGPASARTSPVGGVGSSIAGRVEPSQTDSERKALVARGFPPDAPVGANGLERALELRVEGMPGGTLLAGNRVLRKVAPKPAATVRTTIDTRLQAAADSALGGQYGGVAVLDPRTAQIRALAGIAFSAPQPPGSTFKVVTATAALEAHAVKPSDDFPVQTQATIDGVALENANGESCGGTFAESFAHSCNSVFAPLGVKIGAKRLVSTAERFGWNEPSPVPGAATSAIPKASDINSPLDVGSTAIGQGRVLATPLQMASVSQTIASGGKRLQPTLLPDAPPVRSRVTSAAIARQVKQLMLGVVAYGTGTSAAIPGVKVAGKTGTAELQDTRDTTSDGQDETDQNSGPDPSNTDAWFTAFAPANDPKIAVGVLLVRSGAGGATAAPVARSVMAAALGK